MIDLTKEKTVVSDGTTTVYSGTNPVTVNGDKIGLKYDNQTLQVNSDGQLVANLDELGNEVNTIANSVTNKQDKLVSGTNIKTINGESLLGSGNIKLAGGAEQYGIQGDYATRYGILECPNGILNVNGMQVILKQGVVMQCAGQDIKTMITSDTPYTITATNDIDLFYASGSILECGDVFYQESEPDNGTSNFVAWWKPSKGKWQFKSNETGNVFREAVACRLAHVHTDGTTITRVDYIGNRILDDEIFVEKKDIETINKLDYAETINLEVNKMYSLISEGNVNFVLPTAPSDKLSKIFIQLKISAIGTINLGTNKYFGKQAPDLSVIGLYNITYEYDVNDKVWIVGAIAKG